MGLPYVARVSKLALQGRQHSREYVTEFFLLYSVDGDVWSMYKSADGADQVPDTNAKVLLCCDVLCIGFSLVLPK